MTRVEKRAYKRWMKKHHFWDGAEVIERLQNKKLLVIG
jgi:retron-type reverse transcriptase